MEKTLAEGNGWKITQKGDQTFLSLLSIYGTVEVKARNIDSLSLFEKIEMEYNKLKEQGPIEQPAS